MSPNPNYMTHTQFKDQLESLKQSKTVHNSKQHILPYKT